MDVVDVFEIVDVEHQHRGRLIIPAKQAETAIKDIHQLAAVEEPGQRVRFALQAQLGLDGVLFR